VRSGGAGTVAVALTFATGVSLGTKKGRPPETRRAANTTKRYGAT
jgi:hypothetical protein